MSAGLIGSSFSFPGLGSGVTSSSSSACASSGFHGSQDSGSDIIDFGSGIGFPRFISDLTRRNPTGSLIALVVVVLASVWLLSGGSPRRVRRRRRK